MIIGLSPEPYGYGSPQQVYFLDSLSKILNTSYQLVVPNHPNFKVNSSRNIDTHLSQNHPWSFSGSLERAKYTSRLIKSDNDVLVLVNPASFLILKYLKFKPYIIYLGLEPSIDHSPEIYEAFLQYSKFSDLLIFPNIQRANLEFSVARLSSHKIFIVKNVSPLNITKPRALPNRDFDFLYSGNLEPEKVDIQALNEIGLLGRARVYGGTESNFTSTPLNGLYYGGQLTSTELLTETQSAKFSLTLWKPNSFGRQNASPNKIYSGLAQATPSISFPYPEVVEMVRKYGCGIVSSDYSTESYLSAVKEALEQIDSGKYLQMSEAAYFAHSSEYNWEYQIQPILNFILDSM